MGRKELLAAMVAASTVNYVGRMAMSVAGQDIARQYGFSESELGEIFSAFWLGYAVMMWPSGWLADRFGAGRVLGICGLITAALVGVTPFATGLTYFLVLRLLFGFASAVLYPACTSLTAGWFEARRHAGVQGLVVAGSNFGAAIAPLLMTFIGRTSGWAQGFRVVGAMTFAFFLYFALRVPDKPREDQPSGEGKMRWSGVLILLAAQSFCVGYYYNFTDTWSFYYFREVRHFNDATSALFTTTLQLVGGVMMPLGGLVSDVMAERWGRKRPALAALTLGSIFLCVAAFATEPGWVVFWMAASYSMVVACEGVYWWAVIAHSPDAPATASGLANAVGSAAQFLAPIAFPAIAKAWDWQASVLSAAVAMALAAALWNLVPRQERTQ